VRPVLPVKKTVGQVNKNRQKKRTNHEEPKGKNSNNGGDYYSLGHDYYWNYPSGTRDMTLGQEFSYCLMETEVGQNCYEPCLKPSCPPVFVIFYGNYHQKVILQISAISQH
jgi:hypothetical protein